MEKDGIKRRVSKVAELFRAMKYISDARDVPGGITLEAERLKNRKKNSVELW